MSSPSYSKPTEPSASQSPESLGRYERLKKLINTPPRESTTIPSPLRRNIASYEKYKSLEIKNEDRGEWRETVIKQESPVRPLANEEYPAVKIEESEQPAVKKVKEKKPEHRIPHYMQGTRSFESRLNSRKDEQRLKDALKPRSGGGITKRVGASKIPKYKSTTTINAIDEIKNEMALDDVYIPMATRIKLYEKGLGNASNRPPTTIPTATRSTTKPTRNTESKASGSTSRSRSPQEPSDSSIPGYLRATVSTISRSNSFSETDRSSQESENKKKELKTSKVKPFHFATSERAQYHQETFNEKLRLWKEKEREQKIEQQQKRGTKRKSEHDVSTSSKKQRE